jgi:hypothetical protein
MPSKMICNLAAKGKADAVPVTNRLNIFASLVGRERIKAGADCRMGLGRAHREVDWAELL